jgi:acyl-homoserine-lactone acylase
MRAMIFRRAAFGTSLLLASLLAGCDDDDSPAEPPLTYDVELRRTAMGVPHIKAANAAGIGYGMGYAQADDALCTIADAMLTYRGERSRWFGPDELVSAASTIDRPRNIDSDFFHRHVLHEAAMAAFSAAQPAEVLEMIAGFADGYNRYLNDLRAAAGTTAHAACLDAAWVTPITAADLQKRAFATNFAAGYAPFLPGIANAQPPQAVASAGARAESRAPTHLSPAQRAQIGRAFAQVARQVGGTEGVGSNMYGLGEDATGGAPILFGNPHWYWRGPDRFYQAQITIPGSLNVSGATFLGMPVILIGFNDNVAWSHTVSTARRFGFFELTLTPGNPTAYQRDGATVAMTAHEISIGSLRSDGTVETVTRTLYRTDDGPVVDLSPLSPFLGWSAGTAFVVRDVNAINHRTFRNWMRWARATSLDEFAAIQREESAIPWVNTVAVGRGSAQAWYADIGAIPNVSAEQVATCTTAIGQAMAAALPQVPFFDGSRSACQWQNDPDSKQPGALGPARMPSLLRSDYVANMNDSHWLTNPAAPLTGFPPIIGPTGTEAQSLRTRLGHLMVQQRLAGTDGYAGNQFNVDVLQRMVLNSRSLGGELFRNEALAMVCGSSTIPVAGDPLTGEAYTPPRNVDVTLACGTLANWDATGNPESRGAHVWDEFWFRAGLLPDAELFAIPFSAADPLNTPRGLQPGAADALRQAFGAAVMRVQQSGYAENAVRSDTLFATRDGRAIPLFGGCGSTGYFTIACSDRRIEQGGYTMDGDPNGNSYMQIVSFAGAAPEAHTFLTFSLSDDPASPRHANYTERYATKRWVRIPYTEEDIAAHPDLQTMALQE